MGEPSEPSDDATMPAGQAKPHAKVALLRPCGPDAELPKADDAALLIRRPLRMQQRQIKEHAFDRRKRAVEAVRHALDAQVRCPRVHRIGFCGVAKCVPGQLIHDDDECEPTARTVRPSIVVAGGRGADVVTEPRPDCAIECRVAAEPATFVSSHGGRRPVAGEPEIQHILRCRDPNSARLHSQLCQGGGSLLLPHTSASTPSAASSAMMLRRRASSSSTASRCNRRRKSGETENPW
jgi:hypothetical protein